MEDLLSELKALIDPTLPLISNLSNASAILNKLENINWCGFYLKDDEDNLVLGPFQGEVACLKIPFGKGVCGTALKEKRTLIVENVNFFPGHIACSALSKSEIVVPIIYRKQVKAVIDIDAPIFGRFDENDRLLLEKIAALLAPLFK